MWLTKRVWGGGEKSIKHSVDVWALRYVTLYRFSHKFLFSRKEKEREKERERSGRNFYVSNHKHLMHFFVKKKSERQKTRVTHIEVRETWNVSGRRSKNASTIYRNGEKTLISLIDKRSRESFTINVNSSGRNTNWKSAQRSKKLSKVLTSFVENKCV